MIRSKFYVFKKEKADSIKLGFNNKILYEVKNDMNFMKYIVDELQYKQNDTDYYLLLSSLYEKATKLEVLSNCDTYMIDEKTIDEMHNYLYENVGFIEKVKDILEKNNLI